MTGYLLRGDAPQGAGGVNAYLSRVDRSAEYLTASSLNGADSFGTPPTPVRILALRSSYTMRS